MTKGEQLTEKFFVEVKGWKSGKGYHPHSICWVDKENNLVWKYKLPPLHTSLDLQEEWLWPELFKKWKFIDLEMAFLHHLKEWRFQIDCVEKRKNSGEIFVASAETKALAQLTAGLKALGVETERQENDPA